MKKVLIVLLAVAGCRSEGYYFDGNSTTYVDSEGTSIIEPFKKFESLNFYRSDIRKREPQFLGFDIQDDNIEIDMEIAVPFLSVPTKKNIQGKNRNFANVNVAAVVLAGMVAVGGTLLGGAARFFRGGSFFEGKPWFRTHNKKKKNKREIHHESYIWDTFHDIDDALMQIDFDVKTCIQRQICLNVKNSMMNVEENRARKIDKFVTGFINADWSTRVISSDFLNEGITAAKRGLNCGEKFKTCSLNPENLSGFSNKIQMLVKRSKRQN